MYKLLLLLKKIHYVLLFLVLETVALYFYVNNDPYINAVVLSSTGSATAGLHGQIESVKGYFDLSEQNDKLRAENSSLRERLNDVSFSDTISVDTTIVPQSEVLVLKVVKNTYTKQQNYITLRGGFNQGVKENMALFNGDGIVGYVLKCSDNYSIAVSILNSAHFRTSGRLMNTSFTGSISWDGTDYRRVRISELPKYANLTKGDTILTTSYSNIFPPDMPIGVIDNFELTNGTFYEASIKLFADISSIDYVYAILIDDYAERALLEDSVSDKINF